MGAGGPRPVVLDSGALIAFERADRRLIRLLELAGALHVPAGVVGQVWRNPARQVRLVRLLAAAEVELRDLDVDTAKAAGHLCGATGTADVVDASVVLLAREHRAVVVTSDADDIRGISMSSPAERGGPSIGFERADGRSPGWLGAVGCRRLGEDEGEDGGRPTASAGTAWRRTRDRLLIMDSFGTKRVVRTWGAFPLR